MVEVRDTSKDYDDLVGYKAKENIKTNLGVFLGEEQITEKPEIDKPDVNPDFPKIGKNCLSILDVKKTSLNL